MIKFTNITDHDRAISFFIREIHQYKLLLNGVLRDEYREYINMKLRCYELALEALLKESLKELK